MQFNQHKPISIQNNDAIEMYQAIINALKYFFAEKHDENFVPRHELLQLCKKIPFFQSLSYSDKLEVKEIGLEDLIYCTLKIAKLQEFPLGQILYEKGEDSEKFYILLTGIVCIYKQKTPQELNLELRHKKIVDPTILLTSPKHNDIYTSPKTSLNNDNSNTNDKLFLRPQTSVIKEPIRQHEISWNSNSQSSDKGLKNIKQSFNQFSAGHGILKVKIINTINPFNPFGTENIYLGQQYRENMAMAVTPIKVLTFESNSYKKLLVERDINIKKRRMFFAEYFKELNSTLVDTISQYMECIYYRQGKHIYYENDGVDGLYFLQEGQVKLVKRMITKSFKFKGTNFSKNKDEFIADRIVDEITKGHLFGEELLFSQFKKRRYSAVVTSPRVYVYKLDKKYFDLMCKDHENVVKKMKESCMSKIKWREKRMESLATSKEQIFRLNDFARNIFSPTPSSSEKSLFFITNPDKIKEFKIKNLEICRNHSTCECPNSACISRQSERNITASPTNIAGAQEDILDTKNLNLNHIFFKFNPTPADLCSMPIQAHNQSPVRCFSTQTNINERRKYLSKKNFGLTNYKSKDNLFIKLDSPSDQKPTKSLQNLQSISPKSILLRKQSDDRGGILFQRRSTYTSPRNGTTQGKRRYFGDIKDKNQEKEEDYINPDVHNFEKPQIDKLENISQKLNDLTAYISTALRNYKTPSPRDAKL